MMESPGLPPSGGTGESDSWYAVWERNVATRGDIGIKVTGVARGEYVSGYRTGRSVPCWAAPRHLFAASTFLPSTVFISNGVRHFIV